MADKAKKRIYTEIELDKIYKGEVKLDDKGKSIHKRRQQSREQDREEKGNACWLEGQPAGHKDSLDPYHFDESAPGRDRKKMRFSEDCQDD